jgi:hypothetical protein
MKPIDPTFVHFQDLKGVLRWAQSIFKSLTGNISLATGNLQDSNGIYTTFNSDNGDGIMVRVGAAGSGLKYTWDAGTSQVTIDHALGRQPIGFILCDLDKNAVIWRVIPPTAQFMELQTSDNTCSATVYIF